MSATPPPAWAERDMTGVYVELEHTADVFLEVTGEDLPGLLEHGLYAFYDTLADLGPVERNETRVLEARGAEPADLLRALLTEALFEFDVSGFLAAAAEVTLEEPDWARAVLWGEPLDRSRHEVRLEVKAVTYHQLSAERGPDGRWLARVILDV